MTGTSDAGGNAGPQESNGGSGDKPSVEDLIKNLGDSMRAEIGSVRTEIGSVKASIDELTESHRRLSSEVQRDRKEADQRFDRLDRRLDELDIWHSGYRARAQYGAPMEPTSGPVGDSLLETEDDWSYDRPFR